MPCSPCHVGTTCKNRPEVNNWCRCLPLRACAKLVVEDFGSGSCCEASGSVASQVAMGVGCQVAPPEFESPNSLPGYVGQLRCAGAAIDVVFSFGEDEYGHLQCFLTSSALGYELGYESDTRLRVPMGGEYHDAAIKRANCCHLGIEFDVDLYVEGPEGYAPLLDCGPAKIRLDAGDLIARSTCAQCGPRSNPYSCLCKRACVTYTRTGDSGYGSTSEMQNVCLTEVNPGSGSDSYFEASFEGGAKRIRIYVTDDDPLTYGLVLAEGFGSSAPESTIRVACCHDTTPGCNGTAEWSWDDEYYGSHSVKIMGDAKARCADCKCFWRLMCVRVYDHETGGRYAAVLAYDEGTDEYGEVFRGWRGETENPESGDTFGVAIALKCDQCSGKSYLELAGHPVEGPKPELTCPEILFAQNVGEGSEIAEGGFTVVAESVQCDAVCDVFGVPPECFENVCGDEELPASLTATLTPAGDCPCEEVEVTLQLREFPQTATESLQGIYYQVGGTGPTVRIFAYDSGHFQICGLPQFVFRFLAAPCVTGVIGCDVDEIPWRGKLYEVNTNDDGLGGGFEACLPCSPILVEVAPFMLCPPGAADYGDFNLTLTE